MSGHLTAAIRDRAKNLVSCRNNSLSGKLGNGVFRHTVNSAPAQSFPREALEPPLSANASDVRRRDRIESDVPVGALPGVGSLQADDVDAHRQQDGDA